jgi:hypothetical protein
MSVQQKEVRMDEWEPEGGQCVLKKNILFKLLSLIETMEH